MTGSNSKLATLLWRQAAIVEVGGYYMKAWREEFRRRNTRTCVMLEACWLCPHRRQPGRHDCPRDSIPTLFETRFVRRGGVIRSTETASVHKGQMREIQEVLMETHVVRRQVKVTSGGSPFRAIQPRCCRDA